MIDLGIMKHEGSLSLSYTKSFTHPTDPLTSPLSVAKFLCSITLHPTEIYNVPPTGGSWPGSPNIDAMNLLIEFGIPIFAIFLQLNQRHLSKMQ